MSEVGRVDITWELYDAIGGRYLRQVNLEEPDKTGICAVCGAETFKRFKSIKDAGALFPSVCYSWRLVCLNGHNPEGSPNE